MQVQFTKMQGAGNDFVVLDETRGPLGLSAGQYRFVADRHFGVGADQILSVRPAPAGSSGIDFAYAIHNADGGEVEHCGNGARCFVRYVHDRGLTEKTSIRVQTMNRVLQLQLQSDGRVTVDMGAPVFDLAQIPLDPGRATRVAQTLWEKWQLAGVSIEELATQSIAKYALQAQFAVLSMGNPHAVLVVPDVAQAPVLALGPWVQAHPAFPNRVNTGFMQIVGRREIKLRVFERGAGETLACGTGACAAVVAGIRLGLLDAVVDVHATGGSLTVQWDGMGHSVHMTGPATTVFEGTLQIPDNI